MASGSGPPRRWPPLPGTAETLAKNPNMRVFVMGGQYDSFLPCAAGEETARLLTPDQQSSIRFKCYAGGHAMYEDVPVRVELAADIRAFVSGR